MIAATAESNRSPFDLPGESEIIAGYTVLWIQIPLFSVNILACLPSADWNNAVPR
jgi:NADH:ubiquinone oxidoreductase subunit H